MPHDPARSCDLFFPFEKTVMQPIQEQFIEFALEADVLRFGEFKTKAGRLSPYFFNAGLFNTGALLDRLGEFYAKTLLAARDAGRIEFDMIFGPAYKGIPLAASVAMNLSRLGCDVPWAFNRKEAKDHGEGGVIVGAPLKGKVVIIDDVISAGTSVRESVKIIQANGAVPSGVLIALDRQERGGNAVEMTETSAVQDVEKTLGMNVASIICLNDLLAFMNGDVDYMVMDAPETMELFEANGWELVPQFANAGNVSFVIPITNVPDDPWSNVKVREAVFSHGIDLVGAAAAIVGEAGYHTDAIGYKEATYYDEGLEFTSLDYELAKKMLAEAGYPDGFKTRIVADATTQTQATVIQAELKKLGIEAEVEMPDMNEMQKFWTGENTAGGLMVGAMYFADPILDRLDKFYGPYGYMAGCTDWTDEEYALYDNIRSAKSIEEQDELIYKFCVQFVQKDFHFLPIANAVGRAAVSDRLILGDMASLGISYWNPNMVGCKN